MTRDEQSKSSVDVCIVSFIHPREGRTNHRCTLTTTFHEFPEYALSHGHYPRRQDGFRHLPPRPRTTQRVCLVHSVQLARTQERALSAPLSEPRRTAE